MAVRTKGLITQNHLAILLLIFLFPFCFLSRCFLIKV